MSRTRDRIYQANRKRCLETSDICWRCGHHIDPELRYPHPYSATADHVIPIARGGHNHGQLMPAHLDCNKRRGCKPPPTPHARKWA